jgi:mRNA-degrading endonuclease YafQ of YafQ-DinJ toxin-antitoxin module
VLKDSWAFTVEYDLRVLFNFEADGTKAVLFDLGSHDEVY